MLLLTFVSPRRGGIGGGHAPFENIQLDPVAGAYRPRVAAHSRGAQRRGSDAEENVEELTELLLPPQIEAGEINIADQPLRQALGPESAEQRDLMTPRLLRTT